MNINAFSQYFGKIEDPRQSQKIQYPLFDILFLTVMSVIGGAEGWQDIEDYGKGHLKWFQNKGLFRQGIPVHDTIARVIASIKPTLFQQCFLDWIKAVNKLTEGELIAIDGKTLRGSYNREQRRSTIHMVSAFSSANKLVLGQMKTAEKSNEITAIPELLKLLDIKGCLVSIDAMGCQTNIASTIIAQEGDYLLAVKDNQPTLAKAATATINAHISQRIEANEVQLEQAHGRVDIREYHVVSAEKIAHDFPEWKHIKSIGVAIGYRQPKTGKASLDYRYYISSAALSAEQFAEAVRNHWGIENSLHWVLDATMNEDACQIYRGNAAENLACVRHIALNALRKEKSNLSVRRKQKKAWMKPEYAEQVLAAGFDMSEK